MATRRLELVPLDDLVPAVRNPKRHDQAAIAASIDRLGYVEAIVRDDRTGRLVSGHGRTEALVARRTGGGVPARRGGARRRRALASPRPGRVGEP